MSSSSSSDFENAECFYGGFKNATPWPMQPLVYYTHVPNRDKQRPRERKRNPNCFVKAFRWYTQEHHPKRDDSMSTDRPEIGGFATWLDQKYNEFMEEKRSERTRCAMKRTSTFQVEQMNNFPCDSCGIKNTKRPKSPRKRHRRLTNSRGNTPLRGYSCCTYYPPSSGRSKHKSQSMTSVLLEREVYQIPYDTIESDCRQDRQSEVKRIVATIVDESRRSNHALANTTTSSNGVRAGPSRNNISCQCVQENNVQFDACSEYPSSRAATNTVHTQKPKWPQHRASQQITNATRCELANVTAAPLRTCMQNSEGQTQNTDREAFVYGTQTSDCPISLPTAPYPLFMRIVCPDKPRES